VKSFLEGSISTEAVGRIKADMVLAPGFLLLRMLGTLGYL